jgi:hypothetical protein
MIYLSSFSHSYPLSLNIIIPYSLACYLVVGWYWAKFKWLTFCHNARRQYEEDRDWWFLNNNSPSLSVVRLHEEWTEYVQRYRSSRIPTIPSLSKKNKTTILFWMLFWPFSMIGTVCKLFLDFVSMISTNLMSTFDNVTKHVFEGVESDSLNKSYRSIHKNDYDDGGRKR